MLSRRPADAQRTVLILNANPNADALHPDAIYRLAVDNNGDLLNDIAFSYVFSKPQDGKQTVSVFMAKGDDARSIEAVGTEFSDVPVSFDPLPTIAKSGTVHVFCRRSQRRVLLRLRRDQESLRYEREKELHRSSQGRQVTVERRRFKHTS